MPSSNNDTNNQTAFDEIMALAVGTMTSSFISVVIGMTVCIAMYRSKYKLKTSFRRIIFAMTSYVLISDFASMMIVFRTNKSNLDHFGAQEELVVTSSSSWASQGNHSSAVTLTTILIFGIVGSQTYNLCLSIYYYYVVVHNYRDRKIKKEVEPYLHTISFVFSLLVSVILLSTQSLNYHPILQEYWVSPYPFQCKSDKQVPCGKGDAALILGVILGLLLTICMIANVSLLIRIGMVVKEKDSRTNRHRIRRVSVTFSEKIRERDGSNRTSLRRTNFKTRSERKKKNCERYRIFFVQAAYYVVAFVICHLPTIIISIMTVLNPDRSSPPFAVLFVARILRPLHGVINAFIFTLPRVQQLRTKHNKTMSYFTALKIVVIAGCDNVKRRQSRESTSTEPARRRISLRSRMVAIMRSLVSKYPQSEVQYAQNRTSNITVSKGLTSLLNPKYDDLDDIDSDENAMNENENDDIEKQDNEPRKRDIEEKQSTSSLGLDNTEETGNIVLDKVQNEDLAFIEQDFGKVCNEEVV